MNEEQTTQYYDALAMGHRIAELESLLESLTPGGSEFSDSPENCARWARGRLASVVKEVEKRKAAEAERDALLVACEAFVEAWEKSLQLEKTDTALMLAKAAIAKARGEQ